MAATAAANGPPLAHPVPNASDLHSHTNTRIPHPGLQDPGLHGPSQDPGPRYPHASTRPVFYVPVPPPPPFLPYHWPMPFSFNPFTGFPGMGYGFMPQFPPPAPYMEAPAYVFPQPPIQPVDYRRLLHPPVHPPCGPYQHPNPTRRVHPAQPAPVRQTVNSEVQTEPTHRGLGRYGEGSPLISSDSGHGTTSNCPSSASSSSSSQNQGPSQAGNCSKEFPVKMNSTSTTVSTGLHTLHPAGSTTARSSMDEMQMNRKNSVGKENIPPYRPGHCNMWSVNSTDSMVPVCSSSQQEDEVVRERRISIPDILMSSGGGTPQSMMLDMADKALPQNDHRMQSIENEAEKEKSVLQSPAGGNKGPEAVDNAAEIDNVFSPKESAPLPCTFNELLSASKREGDPSRLVGQPSIEELLQSLDDTQRFLDNENENGNETNPHAETNDNIPYQTSFHSFQGMRKMNESVWSVESLVPYIPREWLQQDVIAEDEAIRDVTEQDENGGLVLQNGNLTANTCKERRLSRRFSSSDSTPMLDSWPVFSTPAVKLSHSKKQEVQSETVAPEGTELKQGQSMTPPEKCPITSPTQFVSVNVSPPVETADEPRSSEPEAHRSPNQESFILNVQREKSPRASPEREETLLSKYAEKEEASPPCRLIHQDETAVAGEDEACRNKEASQLCVPVAQRTTDASPSRTVDFGVQCIVEEEACDCMRMSSNGANKSVSFKYSDVTNGKDEVTTDGPMRRQHKRNGARRYRVQEKQNGQPDTNTGYYGKPWKSRGGNGRNQWH